MLLKNQRYRVLRTWAQRAVAGELSPGAASPLFRDSKESPTAYYLAIALNGSRAGHPGILALREGERGVFINRVSGRQLHMKEKAAEDFYLLPWPLLFARQEEESVLCEKAAQVLASYSCWIPKYISAWREKRNKDRVHPAEHTPKKRKKARRMSAEERDYYRDERRAQRMLCEGLGTTLKKVEQKLAERAFKELAAALTDGKI